MWRFSKKLLIASCIACSVVQPVRPMTPVVEGAVWNVCSLAVGFLCIKLGEWRGFIGRIEGKIDAVDRKTEEVGNRVNQRAAELDNSINQSRIAVETKLDQKTSALGEAIKQSEFSLKVVIEEKTETIDAKIDDVADHVLDLKNFFQEQLDALDRAVQGGEGRLTEGLKALRAHLSEVDLNVVKHRDVVETMIGALSDKIAFQSETVVSVESTSKNCLALIEVINAQFELFKNNLQDTVASREQVAEIKKDVEAHHAEIEKWLQEMQGSRIAYESKLDLMNENLAKVMLALEFIVPASETAASSALDVKKHLATLAVHKQISRSNSH